MLHISTTDTGEQLDVSVAVVFLDTGEWDILTVLSNWYMLLTVKVGRFGPLHFHLGLAVLMLVAPQWCFWKAPSHLHLCFDESLTLDFQLKAASANL